VNNLDGFEKQINKTAVFLSLLIHIILLIIFMFFKFGNLSTGKSEYSTILFSEIPAKTKEKNNPITKTQVEKEPVRKKEKPAIDDKIIITQPEIVADTSIIQKDSSIVSSVIDDSKDNYWQFAQSLLDTFLVRNPVYAKFILSEQAKGIAKRKFSRQILVKKLNDELHKYFKKKYPEGSDQAINENVGPGLQIPIGDVINLVKKIFD
jgi:hypothetical protein